MYYSVLQSVWLYLSIIINQQKILICIYVLYAYTRGHTHTHTHDSGPVSQAFKNKIFLHYISFALAIAIFQFFHVVQNVTKYNKLPSIRDRFFF